MTTTRPTSIEPYALISIGLIAASMLIYEILLTRICALRLFFHFGFLVVSNCLLGIGVSGTMIMLFQERWKDSVKQKVFLFSVLYLISLIVTYYFLLTFDIPAGLKFTEAASLGRFTLFMLISAIPFFFGGAVIGLILTYNAKRINTVYSVDLIGAGLGCLVTPFLLERFGAGGCIVFICLLVIAAIVWSGPVRRRAGLIAGGVILGAIGLLMIARIDAIFPVPGKQIQQLTIKDSVYLSREIVYSKWSAISRVDLTETGKTGRFLYGRGAKSVDEPLPEQMYISQDGWAGTFVGNFSDQPEYLELLGKTLYSSTYRLKNSPRVLVIGAGGGNDIWAAKHHGAQSVRAIELNKQIIYIHHNVVPDFSRGLINDPDVEFVYGEGRGELMRDTGKYDVIQMSGIDTWTALASGAYVLAENYLYTVEALKTMLTHLEDDGMLHIMRFSLEMEALRLLSNTYAAFEELGISDFEQSVMVLTTPGGTAAFMVKPGGFTEEEVAKTKDFSVANGFGTYYLPSNDIGGIVEEFVRSTDKRTIIEEFPRNISPTTDDRPYFFNFTRWDDPLGSRRVIWEWSYISQGNPAFLYGHLGFISCISFILIVLPLIVFGQRGTDRIHAGKFLIYFIGLGIGFIVIEIAMMQKLTLFLGHPMYSITVTLFAILIFTGLGSLISGRWFHSPGVHAWFIPAAIALLVVLFLGTSPWIVENLIGYSLPARIAIAIAMLAPMGLVLGIPFAYGVRLVNQFNPSFVPWAWAVNACFTVIGAVLTVILSMNFGFSNTMLFAILIYCMSFYAASRLPATA